MDIINDDILQQESWTYAWKKLKNPDNCLQSEKISMETLQNQSDELKEFKTKWEDTFGSTIKTTEKADEVLNRQKVLKLIQLAVVFKDVVFGINAVITSSRDIKHYRETFNNLFDKYVKPTVLQFDKDGSINIDNIEKGLYFLKDLKHKCQSSQIKAQSGFITHTINAISTGLQAYATFNSVNTLKGLASQSALWFNWTLGCAQGTMCVGSVVLSGFEAYNYVQYGNVISDIEKAIDCLDTYQNMEERMQKEH